MFQPPQDLDEWKEKLMGKLILDDEEEAVECAELPENEHTPGGTQERVAKAKPGLVGKLSNDDGLQIQPIERYS
ncbi:hypothetical protein DFQ29_007403 [Apophysomyces sp. BC1021]|nr:hypothetical protein DFQ29_007403 [Apophysomyces sp. BC1021]